MAIFTVFQSHVRIRSVLSSSGDGRRYFSMAGGLVVGALLLLGPPAAAQSSSSSSAPGASSASTRINPAAGDFPDPSHNNFVFNKSSAPNPQATNATSQPNISGIWLITPRPELPKGVEPAYGPRELRTMEGNPVPLRPEVAAIYSKRLLDADKGTPFASSVGYCLPGGMPAMMLGAAYPFQVIQSPGQVTTVHEEEHVFRLIYLNQKHPEDPDPTYLGHSVGRWEGSTLLVDTIGVNGKTTVDFGGLPHSDKLHIVERIRRVDKDTLEDVIMLYDPEDYTNPW